MKNYKYKSAKESFLVIGLISALLCVTVMAQTRGVKSRTDFKNAKKTFAKLYPGAKKVSWEKDDHGYHEANFKMEDEKYRADFLPDGKWIETENSIKWSDLPDAIQDQIKQYADKDDITEIEHVNHHKKGEFYDVEFKRKGKNKDIEYRADGSRVDQAAYK